MTNPFQSHYCRLCGTKINDSCSEYCLACRRKINASMGFERRPAKSAGSANGSLVEIVFVCLLLLFIWLFKG